MALSAEYIDLLRKQIPVSEVIGKKLILKKHGREYLGRFRRHRPAGRPWQSARLRSMGVASRGDGG